MTTRAIRTAIFRSFAILLFAQIVLLFCASQIPEPWRFIAAFAPVLCIGGACVVFALTWICWLRDGGRA